MSGSAMRAAKRSARTPSDRKVIPMTIELGDDHSALVVSGPNAGGKTVALKTAGLLVAMGMSGLPRPGRRRHGRCQSSTPSTC